MILGPPGPTTPRHKKYSTKGTKESPQFSPRLGRTKLHLVLALDLYFFLFFCWLCWAERKTTCFCSTLHDFYNIASWDAQLRQTRYKNELLLYRIGSWNVTWFIDIYKTSQKAFFCKEYVCSAWSFTWQQQPWAVIVPVVFSDGSCAGI